MGYDAPNACPYDPTQMGAQECHWHRIVPSGAAMLAAAKLGKQHWYTAVRYANLLYNVVSTTVTTRLDKSRVSTSALDTIHLIAMRRSIALYLQPTCASRHGVAHHLLHIP